MEFFDERIQNKKKREKAQKKNYFKNITSPNELFPISFENKSSFMGEERFVLLQQAFL